MNWRFWAHAWGYGIAACAATVLVAFITSKLMGY